MNASRPFTLAALAALTLLFLIPRLESAPARRAAAAAGGWFDWRGPQQNGTSLEKGLPDTWTPGGANSLWEIPLSGGGTPVIANGRVYALGYRGQGPDLQEIL